MAALGAEGAQVERAAPTLADGVERARRVRCLLRLVASTTISCSSAFRRYTLRRLGGGAGFEVALVPGSGLGLFRDDATSRLHDAATRRGDSRRVARDPRGSAHPGDRQVAHRVAGAPRRATRSRRHHRVRRRRRADRPLDRLRPLHVARAAHAEFADPAALGSPRGDPAPRGGGAALASLPRRSSAPSIPRRSRCCSAPTSTASRR